ncbi:unnamed protein product [Rotaria sp. Silwood1]|nr:unnamed protein product [Rotaria sp. Silwood1]
MSVIAQPPLRRVKYYQQPCLKRKSGETFLCFYDEQLMCLCDRTNYANCFNLNSGSLSCPWNKCSNRGKCIQTYEKCPTASFCFCEPCSYGSICQFTTSGYAMSLDTILGSHVHRRTPNILNQTTTIQISVGILSTVICIGILLNIFAIGTFAEKNTRQVGSGLYLLISSLLGLFTLIILMCKIMFLISVEQYNISCLLFEFLLKWGSTCSEWLYACVGIERTLAVIQKIKYSSQASKRRAIWIIASVLISIGGMCSPELIYYRTVLDRQDQKLWCVFTLNKDEKALQTLYFASNITLFMTPFAINMITSIIIIHGTVRSKGKTGKVPNLKHNAAASDMTTTNNKNNKLVNLKNHWKSIKEQIIKHKHILIAPTILGIMTIARLVLTFRFVCAKLDQNPYSVLCVYLTGFLPSMSVLVAFILPSEGYRKACITFIKQIIPKYIQTLFANRRCLR